jgi:hypothetical protein
MSSFDILCLRSFIATAQDDDERLTVLRVINAVARAVVDAQLANAVADALPVTQESGLQAVETRHDPCTRRAIPEVREPLSHRRLAVDSLVLADLHFWIVAEKLRLGQYIKLVGGDGGVPCS